MRSTVDLSAVMSGCPPQFVGEEMQLVGDVLRVAFHRPVVERTGWTGGGRPVVLGYLDVGLGEEQRPGRRGAVGEIGGDHLIGGGTPMLPVVE